MLDDEIVKKIIQGDHESFKVLIQKYQQLVTNTSFKILRNEEDAKDVCQDVFFEAYRSMLSLRQTDDISFWLYRVALNKSLNYLNKTKNQQRAICLDSGEPELVAEDTPSPHKKIELKEAKQILYQAIQQLPKRQCDVFMLHKVEGLSNKEISKILNISLSGIESLMHRAKENLRKSLENYYRTNFK